MTIPVNTAAGNILLLSSFVLCQLVYAQSKTIEITDPRPVSKAVEQVEAIYSWPITYEDPLSVHESQLQDVTEKVQRTPDSSHRVIIQRGGTLSFTYKLPSSAPLPVGEMSQDQAEAETAVAEALSSILDGYTNSGGPVSFTVTEDEGVFHVVPTNFLNKEGRIERSKPILDTKISIPQKRRTRIQLLMEICESLSKATGITVGAGNFPYNGGSIQSQSITNISGSDVAARMLLIQLLAEMDATMSDQHTSWTTSWQLLYGPGWGYMLNFHHVIRKKQ
jgi:hypothetical protein